MSRKRSENTKRREKGAKRGRPKRKPGNPIPMREDLNRLDKALRVFYLDLDKDGSSWNDYCGIRQGVD